MAHKAHEYLNISNDIMTYTNKYTAVKCAAECAMSLLLLLLLLLLFMLLLLSFGNDTTSFHLTGIPVLRINSH